MPSIENMDHHGNNEADVAQRDSESKGDVVKEKGSNSTKVEKFKLALAVDALLREYSCGFDSGDDDGGQAIPPNALTNSRIQALLRQKYNIFVSAQEVQKCVKEIAAFYSYSGVKNDTRVEHQNPRKRRARVERIVQTPLSGSLSKEVELRVEPEVGNDDKSNKKRWYWLERREFEESEIAYLVSLVQNSPRIDGHIIREKLNNLLSKPQRERIETFGSSHTGSQQLYSFNKLQGHIADLQKALKHNNRVSFYYYNVDRGKPESCERYIPLCVEFVEGYWYFVAKAKKSKHPPYRTFRIDRITSDVELCDSKGWPTNHDELADSARDFICCSVNRMPSEDIRRMRVRCYTDKAARIVRENFDTPARKFEPITMNAFPICYEFNAATGGFVRWAMKHVDDVEVENPPEVLAAIRDLLDHNRYSRK